MGGELKDQGRVTGLTDKVHIQIVDIVIVDPDNIVLVEVFLGELLEMVVDMAMYYYVYYHIYYHIHIHIHYHLHGFVIQEYLREYYMFVLVGMYVYLLVVQQLVH